MLRKIASLCAALLVALGVYTSTTRAEDRYNTKDRLVVKRGDLIIQKDGKGWSAIKILAVDPWPDGTATAHCLTYKSVQSKPTIELLKNAAVLVWHAPIDAASFGRGWERIGNKAPSKEELIGFAEYLKLTDFPRYISFTGQDAQDIVRKANEHYKRAYELGEQGKRVESIAEYDRAIDLFPRFYEAIDNRAFTYMELGQIRDALHDFEQSLRINPNGMSAFFQKANA
ncbi:tetratricopeptide repeat protein [Chromobacterium violaceum]|uniref:tetratricopeptide repeat protein n=1 Tax=Chromobacterium violaceum TaxID=536 RepID=UPI003CF716A5